MNTKEPSVLVVTPTLGDSPFLGATIDSVAALPVPHVHVLSVPVERGEELRRRFPGVQVVADAGRAGGIYGAINAAIAQAKEGWDWFTYINDDDELLPGFGKVALGHLKSAEPEPVTYGDVELSDEAGRVVSRVTTEPNPAWFPALLQGGISPLMQQGMLMEAGLIRRLGGFDLRYRLCGDLDLWLRAYAGGARFRYYPARVARFRLRRGQLSGDTHRTESEQDEIVARHLPLPVPRWKRRLARWRYRLYNLPRYAARARAGAGLKSSYELLREGGAGP
jgi:GT2 family glycosyltransferase